MDSVSYQLEKAKEELTILTSIPAEDITHLEAVEIDKCIMKLVKRIPLLEKQLKNE